DFLGTNGSAGCPSGGLCFYLETGGKLTNTTDVDDQGNIINNYYVDKGPTLSMTPPKDSNGNPNATVANYGTISTNPDANSSGYVFLIGPNVENWGSITAPQGQIGLIGSTGPVTLAQGNCGTNCVRPGLVVTMPDTSGGSATNGYDDAQSLPGKMNAAEGIIGMYGLLVQQNGIITAT